MVQIWNNLPAYRAFMEAFAPQLVARRKEVAESRASPEEQPVRYFLSEAWIRRADQLLEGLGGGELILPRKNLTTELAELESWLGFEPAGSQDPKSLNGAGQFLINHGASFAEAQRLVNLFKKPKRGAPPKIRQSTVAVLDQKLSKNLSWAELTRQVCTCGKTQHSEQCEDTLRKRVNELQKILSKYGWTLVE